MSEFGAIIWHTLAYLALPTIFIAGFAGVFLVAVAIMRLFGKTPVED